jgi:small subunit ribosomal protein S3
MASHLERGTAFRRATMWTIQQIMEGGAMGVEITISGKLRGDRSAFEKHRQGILPRAGHHADMIVSEDIAHVETAMGLIGVRIRIAQKEKLIPEFEMRGKTQAEKDEEIKNKKEADEALAKAQSESEIIKIEEEKMKEMPDTMEDEEEKMK